MIKLFGGTDSYESYTKAKTFAQKLADEKSIELKIMNADEVKDIQEILIEVEGIGMFSESKVLLLKRLVQNKKILTYFAEHLDKLDAYDIILWEENKPDGKLSLTKNLTKKKALQLFELPKPWLLENWVADICKAKKISLSKKQITYLVERVGDNKWMLINELKKLHEFSKSNEKITDQDLAILVGVESKGDIWNFVDFFISKDLENSLSEFKKLMRFESNVFYVIAMIQRELQILCDVIVCKKSKGDYKDLKLHPFVLQKALKKAEHYSLHDLHSLALELMTVEYKIKSGKLPENIAFQNFMLKTIL